MDKTKILVVDDEEVMRETLCRGLSMIGCQCLTAKDGGEALKVLSGPQMDQIELLLTDLSMPGKSGLQLIDQVHRVRPDLPVIVITGLAFSPEIEAIRARGIPVLPKPFNPYELEQAILDLLDRRDRQARQGRSTMQTTTR